MTEMLPENIGQSYPNRNKGDVAHQHHHDVIHRRLNAMAESPGGVSMTDVRTEIEHHRQEPVPHQGALSGRDFATWFNAGTL